MIKKLICAILVAAMAISLCACAGDDGKNSSTSSVPNIDAKVSAAPDTATPEPVKKVDVATISDDGVNIRAGASTEDEILTQANKGDAFYLVQKDAAEGWNKITYNGKDAFVSADYSTVSSVTEAEAKALVAGETPPTESEASNSENESGSDSSGSESSASSSSEESRSREDGQRR